MLKPIRPGLRTIHNGTRDVAKAYVVVPAGGELTVPDGVADQLQRDQAFKDGPCPDELAALVEADNTGPVEDVPESAPVETAERDLTPRRGRPPRNKH